MTLVETRQLQKNYPTPTGLLQILEGVNFSLEKGQFAAITGPSGIGKTTFLNMITGIDKPTAGEVVVNGTNITAAKANQLTKWRVANIGIVFQQFQLLPNISVLDNVAAPLDLIRIGNVRSRRKRAMEVLRWFGIADQAQKTPDMLSGGQQQRVAIARALVADPDLIVADEPTANLDHMSAEIVFDVFNGLTKRGKTVIMTTYDLDIVRNVPHVFVLNEQRLQRIQNGTPAHSSLN